MKVLSHAFKRSALMMAALAVCLLAGGSHAQGPAGNSPLKEVQVAADAFSLGDPVPAWVESVPIPEPGRVLPVVVRLADTQYFVEGTPVAYVRRAVTINDAGSLTSAGQIAIPFVPEYHKLKLHAVRVLRGGESLDRTASSTIRFLQRETALESGIYVGEVTASILVKDLRVGDTLEYSYSLHGQNPVFGDKFVDIASWDQGPPTLLRRVVLRHPASRQIFWRISGESRAGAVVPKETVEDGMRKLVFEERSMAKVDLEPLTPLDYPAYRMLHFSEFAGWDGVVAWAADLFQSKGVASHALRDVIETLKKRATEEERVVGALEFVQSQIRYFSVSLGESSHRPTQPDLVLERRYGDCKDHETYLFAIAEAMRQEYETVAGAGFVLQIDCPDLGMGRHIQYADLSLEEFRKRARQHVEALNHALRNIPAERLRLHLCWGNYEGPHHCDVALADIADIVFLAKPQAISLEAANPRHAHEWALFERVKLPEGKVLIPGVIESKSNFIEHPELIAQRIARYASLVGRENVIAGSDCGFGTWVGQAAVDPDVVWAKFAAIAEGARIATRQFWR